MICLGLGLFVLSWGLRIDREPVSASVRVVGAASECVFASGIGLYGFRRAFRPLTAVFVALILVTGVTDLALHDWDKSLSKLVTLSRALLFIPWIWLVLLDQGRAWPKDSAVGRSRIRRSRGHRF